MRHAVLLLAVTLVGGQPNSLAAQQDGPRPSQHGTVSQTINQTVVTIEYDRPVARGRALFGGIVEWDELWAPGANRTSWIDVSTDVTIEGHKLPAGRYGIWMTPRENGAWDVVLVSDWDTFHTDYPSGSEALDARVLTEPGAHMEVMAFYFPEVGPYETTLRFHWGEMILPLRIEVPR